MDRNMQVWEMGPQKAHAALSQPSGSLKKRWIRKDSKARWHCIFLFLEWILYTLCVTDTCARDMAMNKMKSHSQGLTFYSKFIKRSVTSDCQPCCLFCLPPSRRPPWLVRMSTPATINGRQEKVKGWMFTLTMKAELGEAICPSKGRREEATHAWWWPGDTEEGQ